MNALQHKLQRDIRAMLGQILAIATVVAAGVMVLIISVSTKQSIELSQQRFYQTYQFADLFAQVTRAPNDLIRQVEQIDGVNIAETRIQAAARFSLAGFAEPIQGQIVSIPDYSEPLLNRLHYLYGGRPAVGAQNEIVVSEPFADAHGLQVGDGIHAILNGRIQALQIVGIALSPEYIYQVDPNSILPDYARYGVFWMNRSALAAAFDMDGAFNNITLSLQSNADSGYVSDSLNLILQRYGSQGAYGRYEQVSHRFLSEELQQLGVMAVVLPTIFLGVAAFLLNILMTRIIHNQRQPIALLKAFGYSNRHIIQHYLWFTTAVVGIGLLGGIVLGMLVAQPMASLYATYFRFPEFIFGVQPRAIAIAFMVAIIAGVTGTFRAVYAAAKRPPAESMRPPSPPIYHRSWLDMPWLRAWFNQPVRIILRNIQRFRLRASLSILGIALSASLLVVGSYQFNAVNEMLTTQYRQVLRMNLDVQFTDVTPGRALYSLQNLAEIDYAEGYRSVPIQLSNNRKEWRLMLLGLNDYSELRSLPGWQHPLPTDGILLTRYLAEDLQLELGDHVSVQVLTGRQQQLQLPLAGIIDEPIGLGVYMQREALNTALREGDVISGAWLLSQEHTYATLFPTLQEMPMVASITQITKAEREIRTYIDNTILGFMAVMFVLAGSITFAVVYNNARILFAERERELATMRVLGFSKAEVAATLLGELAVLVVLAIPLGWAIGMLFSWLLVTAMSIDLFRIPFILSPHIFALSAIGVLLAALLSLGFMLKRIWQLDMIQSLKTE